MGDSDSSSNVVSASPSSSQSSCAPLWGPSHRLQIFMNCSSKNLLHGKKLLHHGSCGVTSPATESAASWASLLLRVTGPARNLFEHGLPMGSWSLSGIYLLQHGVLCRLERNLCAERNLQRHPLPLLQWPWFLQSCFSHTLTSLSGSCFPMFCFPLLKQAIPEALPQSLAALALPRNESVLALSLCLRWFWHYWTQGKILVSFHGSHPCSWTAAKILDSKHCIQTCIGSHFFGVDINSTRKKFPNCT